MKPKPIWNWILLFAIIFVMLQQMDFSSVWTFCQGDISVMLTFRHEDILTWGHYVTRTFWLEDIPVAECQWVWRGRGEIGYYHRSSKGLVKPFYADILPFYVLKKKSDQTFLTNLYKMWYFVPSNFETFLPGLGPRSISKSWRHPKCLKKLICQIFSNLSKIVI